ncbi:DUF924 family protein [Pararhodobacter oceanensis]|uniref:DUF924 family protein n=1 Tax=Pararhodobacter oceanensis TaxID=2172121 RepID=UPI003A90B39D
MPLPALAAEILAYWKSIGPQGWYAGGEELDAEITARFLPAWEAALEGAYKGWQSCPEGMLAYLVLTDQFPRNMFRNDPRAFATDPHALMVADRAWQRRLDLKIDGPIRQFFYLPFMHSESIFDQNRCVCLILARMPQAADGSESPNLLHARAHREVIRSYQRFPYRNDALGRQSTPEELGFLNDGGYASIVQALQN